MGKITGQTIGFERRCDGIFIRGDSYHLHNFDAEVIHGFSIRPRPDDSELVGIVCKGELVVCTIPEIPNILINRGLVLEVPKGRENED